MSAPSRSGSEMSASTSASRKVSMYRCGSEAICGTRSIGFRSMSSHK